MWNSGGGRDTQRALGGVGDRDLHHFDGFFAGRNEIQDLGLKTDVFIFSRDAMPKRTGFHFTFIAPREKSRLTRFLLKNRPQDQGWRFSTLTQKFRPERVLCRSSVDSGRVRKLWSPVLMSPFRVGVIEESIPASLHSGKYSRLMRSGVDALKTSLSPVNRHPDRGSSGFLFFSEGRKFYHFL